MKCPILSAPTARTAFTEHYAVDCLQGDCAWWDDTLKECLVKTLAKFTVGASVYLHNISENMPFKATL